MDNNFILVEYLSNTNCVINKAFQSMQRIKLVCFDASSRFLIFGATSGGIYIFKREPCEFLKLIPNKEGSANLVAISPLERHLGVATSRGLIIVVENFIDNNCPVQLQVFPEQRNFTCLKWHRNELYAGDDKGKVSVINASFQQSKSIFQVPNATLMTLDSQIVQIDAYQCYLLISTQTRTYLCNTEQEHYIQIGKKLRDGPFGACFCNTSSDVGQVVYDQNIRSPFRSVKATDAILTSNGDNVKAKIFCARPGARIWEVGFNADVLVTYQFKGVLNQPQSEVFVIGCTEEAVLQRSNDGPAQKVPDNFNFQTLHAACDRFLLTHDSDRVYVFDPASSKLLFWTQFPGGIKAVTSVDCNFYVWKNNLEIAIISVADLEHVILSTLYKKQYYLCAELCLEFAPQVLELLDQSKKLYLIGALKSKLRCQELLTKLGPVLDKVKALNDKVLALRQQKSNEVVLVENLHQNQEQDQDEDLKALSKQYKLNKTHRTIDIPLVRQVLEPLDVEQIHATLERFIWYVPEDNVTEWCQEQYLKQISQRNSPVADLPGECFDFLTRGLLNSNRGLEYSCPCGYPLPKSHKTEPRFHNVALAVLEASHDADKMTILKRIPYLWRYQINASNIPALIHYGDLGLFKEHALGLCYDRWHDVLGHLVKFKQGVCLNCDRKIDIESSMTWTEVAKVITQSLGARNALGLLEKYHTAIPNGALDQSFYQTCILAHSVADTQTSPEKPFEFFEGLNGASYVRFQDCLAKHFKRRHASCCYSLGPEEVVGRCQACQLPLKNQILYERDTAQGCEHQFHRFCLERTHRICKLCQ